MQKVEAKTGVAHHEIVPIVTIINNLKMGMAVDAKELRQFYLLLEAFYKKA